MNLEFHKLTPEADADLASLIRHILKNHHLDIPGTAYFDKELDHLSSFYSADPEKRTYYVLTDQAGQVMGGIGLADFPHIPGCAELQKLYLAESAQGSGFGYDMIEYIENRARELGYASIYLETHTNLAAAMHIYEKSGYRLIDRPESVVHTTMNRFYLKQLDKDI